MSWMCKGLLRNMSVVALLCCLLAGCKTELFTKQTEGDANDMVAALREHGILAEKESPDGGKSWTVRIEEEDIVQATNVLHSLGLPVERHESLGQIFKKDGLISTPTEERVRFIHGVTQELSETLSHIDGVVVARVQIVLPQNDPMAPVSKPSSASVFVKHRPEANVHTLVPAIKNLVARSVEGLPYENVSVTMIPGMPLARAHFVERSAVGIWMGTGGVLLTAALAALAWAAYVRAAWLPEPLRRVLDERRFPARQRRAAPGEPAAASAGAST